MHLPAVSLFLALLCVYPTTDTDKTRVLASGVELADARLRPLKTLNDYFPFTPPTSLSAWQDRRRQVREQILVATGLWPMPQATPLMPVIHGKIDLGDYTVEKVSFASMPGHYVTGNLYVPKKRSGKIPGILSPHGHWNNGRFYDALKDGGTKTVLSQLDNGAEFTVEGARFPLQARCAQLARLGCVVFHYDMVGTADSQAIAHRAGFLDAAAQLRLQSFMGLQTYNSVRALDFLMSLPAVDPQRIGVTGASGGGTQTFILCAIDDRPAVAFPAVMVSTAMQGGCICENCSYLRIGSGNVEFAALFAPKPLAMSGANDWTVDLASKGLPELKTLYGLYGDPALVQGTVYKQFGHNYNGASRLLAYEWFNKHLQLGHKSPIHETPFIALLPRELSVYDDKHPRPSDEKNAVDLRSQMAQAAERQWQSFLPTDRASLERFQQTASPALRVMLGGNLPAPKEVGGRETGSEAIAGVHVQKLILERTSRKQEVPALWLSKDKGAKSVVIWIDPRGKASLLDGEKIASPVQQVLDSGSDVLAIDVLGTGEWPAKKALAVNEEFAGFTYGYNLPLVAQRVQDILAAVAYARNRGLKANLVGFGEAGPWVLLARGLCGDAVDRTAADVNRFNFANVLRTDDAMMLPGALKYGGLDCLAAVGAPHPLLTHNYEGGRPGPWLRAAYAAAGKSDNLKLELPRLADNQVIAWLLH